MEASRTACLEVTRTENSIVSRTDSLGVPSVGNSELHRLDQPGVPRAGNSGASRTRKSGVLSTDDWSILRNDYSVSITGELTIQFLKLKNS